MRPKLLVPMCALMAGLSSSACGGATPRSDSAATLELEEPVRPEAAPAPPVRHGSISRAELDAMIDGGLGRFLAHVETEPHLDGGAFVGFRVVALSGSLFEGVDLAVGDTLLSVNGLPIERPEQALAAWNGLRVASELTVEYLRDGEPQQLRFEIEEAAPPPAPANAARADAT